MKLSNAFKAMTGRTNLLRCASLGMAGMLLLSGAHRTIAASAPELGLVSGNEYIGEQFFWNATWSRQWTADTTLTTSVPDQYEQLVLHGDSANFGVLFTYDTMADAFAREVYPESGGDMVVLSADAWSGAGDVPYLSATVEISTDNGPVIEYLEVAPAMANSFADGNQVTMLVAAEADFEQAFQDVQNDILPNGGDAGPAFVGTPAGVPVSAGGSDQSSAPSNQSSAESAYLDALSSEIDTLTQSLTDFQTLIQNPAWDDQTWKISMATILFSWIAAHDDAQSIVPPDQYAEMHQTYVDFTALLAGAAQAIAYGDFDTATNDLTQAQTKLMRLERMLESGGVDILDAKAG